MKTRLFPLPGRLAWRLLLPVAALLLLSCCGDGEPSLVSPDELARNLVDMLRRDDREGFMRHLYLSENHLQCLAEYGGEELDGGVQRNLAVLPWLRTKTAWEWTEARDAAFLAGLDWSQAEYVGVTYNLEQEQSFLFGDLRVRVRSGHGVYELRLNDCVKCGGRWFTMDSLHFEGRIR